MSNIPYIKWYQSKEEVFIEILKKNSNYNVVKEEDNMLIYNDDKYNVKLKLSNLFDIKEILNSGNNLKVILTKNTSDKWTNLLENNKLYKHYISTDWDKYLDDELEEEAKMVDPNMMNMMNNPEMMNMMNNPEMMNMMNNPEMMNMMNNPEMANMMNNPETDNSEMIDMLDNDSINNIEETKNKEEVETENKEEVETENKEEVETENKEEVETENKEEVEIENK